jgi:hypothetical protein
VTTETKTAPAPAIGYSIVANLGDDRQMTIQCFVGEDEKLSDAHKRIDRVLSIVDRQKAKYSLKELHKDRAKQAQTLAQGEEDFARIELDHDTAKAGFDLRQKEIAEERESIHSGAHSAGRSKPVGAAASRDAALARELKEIQQSLDKNEAERNQYRANVLISIDRFRKAVDDLDARIAECEAITNGE